ncbi:MAG: hypothetical protein ABGX20_04475 [Bacillus sp. (in: firmicutes)]
MQMLLWAIGATLVLSLIIAFLPIGINFRGKIFVVLAAFVLALGGLTAVATFPMWQTALLLFLLILVTAYIMDSRLGSVMYLETQDVIDHEVDEDEESFVTDTNIDDHSTELDLLDSNLDSVELSPVINLEKAENPIIHEQPDYIVENDEMLVQPQMIVEDELNIEVELEDRSFLDELIETDINGLDEQNEPEELDVLTDLQDFNAGTETEEGYLADIESLLLEESDELNKSEEEGWLEEITTFTLETKEEEPSEIVLEENDLEELFLAVEEAAAGNEVDIKESKLEKELNLQK